MVGARSGVLGGGGPASYTPAMGAAWRRGRGRPALVLLVVLAIAVGCSAADPAPAPATDSAAPATMRLEPLRLDEVRTLPALGFDLRAQPVLDPGEFDLASMPGRCGAALPLPFRSGNGLRVFKATNVLVVEAIVDAGATVADQVLTAARADGRPDCGSFADTREGRPVTARPDEMATLPDLGDDHVGWHHELISPDGSTQRMTALYRSGSHLALLVVWVGPNTNRAVIAELAGMAFTVR